MASYDELYAMIIEESVKGVVGRAGLKTVEGVKKVTSTIKDKATSTKDKVVDTYNKAEANEKIGPAVKATANVTKKVAGVATYPISKSSEVIANKIVDNKEKKIRDEFKGNPEKMEKELKKNVERLDELKSDIMALEVWTIGLPLAMATLGTMDNVLKGVIAAGAAARNDKDLAKGVIKASLWAPYALAKISKIRGKEITGDSALKSVKEIINKIMGNLKSWAESDQPLLNKTVTESVNTDYLIVSVICESLVNDIISYEEAAYLIESAGFETEYFE